MGHTGHDALVTSVIHQAEQTGATPFFVVSRSFGKDDPIPPETKVAMYKKKFPKYANMFSLPPEGMTTLNEVLANLATQGYTDVTLIVGEQEKAAFGYLTRPAKDGIPPYQKFGLNSLQIMSRQDTKAPGSDPTKPDYHEGPRATPMREVLTDPNGFKASNPDYANMSDDQMQYTVWRQAMNSALSDQEVLQMMNTAKENLAKFNMPKPKGRKLKEFIEKVKPLLEHATPEQKVKIYNQLLEAKKQLNELGEPSSNNLANKVAMLIHSRKPEIFSRYGDEKVMSMIIDTCTDNLNKTEMELAIEALKRLKTELKEGAPIVVAQAPIDVRNPKKAPQSYRNQGDIVPPTQPPSTEKRGVKGRPGQRPMPDYSVAEDKEVDPVTSAVLSFYKPVVNDIHKEKLPDYVDQARDLLHKTDDPAVRSKLIDIFKQGKQNPYIQGGIVTTVGALLAGGVLSTAQSMGLSPAQTNLALQAILNTVIPTVVSRINGKNWADTIKYTLASAGVGTGIAGAGLLEDSSLSVEQLATISDEALDNRYHYGRSTPGNSFGWQANLASAAYAKKAIESGITDIGRLSDAVHKGWWSVAQKFVDDPDQFDDTEKLRASGKFDKKMADRIAQMVPFNQLTKDQQDIDSVVAVALLQAIKGGELDENLGLPQPGTYEETHMMKKPFGHRAMSLTTESNVAENNDYIEEK